MSLNSKKPGGARRGRRFPVRVRLAGLAVGLVAAALVASGCSSSSTSSAAAPASSSAASSAAATGAASSSGPAAAGNDVGITATTIKVGLIADVNTSVAPGLFQKSVDAMNAWAKNVNASGGIAGRQVQIDFCDGKLDPNATTNCVIKACQNDFALVGTAANALVDLADIDSCKNAAGQPVGLPNLAAFAFLPEACDPDTYVTGGYGPYCATAKQNPQTYTVNNGDSKYYLSKYPGLHGISVYASDVPSLKVDFIPMFTSSNNLGIKKDGQGFYGEAGTTPQSGLTPVIAAMKAAGSNYIYAGGTPQNTILLQREAKLQGISNNIKVWACNSGCYDPTFFQQGGATSNGTYANLTDLPYMTEYQDNPSLAALVKAVGGVNNINNNAVNSYIMGLLFQDAVTKATANGGTLNRTTLFAALKAEHSFNADGIIGATDVGNHVESACFDLVQLVNGNWQRVYPTKPGTFDCNASNLTTIKTNVPL